jgi:membrane fusion protein (multidrug efflux system)
MNVKQTAVAAARVLGALAALIVILLWMSGAFADKVEPGTAEVERSVAAEDAPTAPVVEQEVAVVEEAAGTVQAERRTLVSSRILAVIREITVRAGDTVEQGDVLVELDDREPKARVEEARRAVEAARAARERTASDYERARRLLAQGVISQSEYDQAESAFRIADAELARAREAEQAAEVSLSYTAIRAPVSGRIIDRLADPGDTAVPGEPILSLYDPTALRLEVPVRESLLGRLAIGDELDVRVGEAREDILGRIDEIVPQAETGSRTFLVKVGLPKRQGIYTGMFGRVLLPAGRRTRVLVPSGAIEQVGQLDFVTVVGPRRELSRRLVTLGQETSDGRFEVLSGLRPGETVLLQAAPLSPTPAER